MKIVVNVDVINSWILLNGPYGHEKLSVTSEVSYPTIGAIRRGRAVSVLTLKRLAKAMGLKEEDLFSLAATRKRRAS